MESPLTRCTGVPVARWPYARHWRNPDLQRSAEGLFPEGCGTQPDPTQWEMDLGDTLPLQTRAARTERSDGARPGMPRHG